MTQTAGADIAHNAVVGVGAVFDQSYRENLAKRSAALMDAGIVVLPVIPIELPADRWPHVSRSTGEPVINKDGEKIPRFSGKAPSSWNRVTGEPQLLQRKAFLNGTRKPPSRDEVLATLLEPVTCGAAGEFDSAIGICVMTTEQFVVIDLDDTSGNEELIRRATAAGHYIETTPSGGLHLVVSPEDAMASWANGNGFFTKWALAEDDPPVGEVLSNGKVCLMAPTMRGDGHHYAVPAFSGNDIQTVPDITSALGIYPTASAAKRSKTKASPPTKDKKPASKSSKRSSWAPPTSTPHISTLVGRRAGEMLNGNLSAYGDPAKDRSSVLTAFAREVYGTENWLLDEELEFEGTADELIDQVIDSLGAFDGTANEPIETKAERILETIDRDLCDIQDPEKRRNRYDYQSGIRTKPLADVLNGCLDHRPPFVIRGYTSDSIIFGVEETGLDVPIKANALNKSNLLTLAGLEWWRQRYGDDQTSWTAAADDLLRLRSNHSIYDPSNMRGCGVWRDSDQVVVHTGGQLLVDGEPVAFAHHESQFTYVKQPPLKGPSEEATLDELRQIEQVLRRWNFADNAGPAFLLGWLVTSSLSGALSWRPNIWLTAPTTSGKSTLIDEVVRPLGRAVGGRGFGNSTTAAGLRQQLGHSAVPVVIDEFESDSDADRRRVDQIISLVRSSSSNDGAEVVKGTTSGNAISYLIRSSFCFASIDVGLDRAQDANRTQVVRLAPLTPEQRASELETMQLCRTIDEDLGAKVLARAIRLLPTIEENALILQSAINRRNKGTGNSRLTKIQGLLLAGYLVFTADGDSPLSVEQADAWVEGLFQGAFEQQVEAAADVVDAEESDALACLRHLMLHRIRITRTVGNDPLYLKREQVEITVQEALAEYMAGLECSNYEPKEITAVLLRHGLKLGERDRQKVLMLAVKTHAGAKKIFENHWRNYPETLRRAGAGGLPSKGPTSFGGKAHQHRYVYWPISSLVEQKSSEMKMTNHPPEEIQDMIEDAIAIWEVPTAEVAKAQLEEASKKFAERKQTQRLSAVEVAQINIAGSQSILDGAAPSVVDVDKVSVDAADSPVGDDSRSAGNL